MKKFFLSAAILTAALAGNAQLTNTKWKGTLPLDNPLDVVLDFQKDTLRVLNAQDQSILETMTYAMADTALVIQKVSGMSDCTGDAKGKYRVDIMNDEMYLRLVMDDCDGRSFYLKNSKWNKFL